MPRANDEIGAASARPGDVRAYAMDVTDAASVAGAMAAIVAELGAPAIVVNNAGIPALGEYEPASDISGQKKTGRAPRGIQPRRPSARAMREKLSERVCRTRVSTPKGLESSCAISGSDFT